MNKLKCLFLSGLMAVMPVCMSGQQTPGEKSSKPRVIITCDPELDDLNSLIRFLLFSTDLQIYCYRVSFMPAASSIGKVTGTARSGMCRDVNIPVMA